VEPYLLQIGFVRRTKRGREITPKAREHLGLPAKPRKDGSVQPELFDPDEP